MRKSIYSLALSVLFLLFHYSGLLAQADDCKPPTVSVPITTFNSATVTCFNPNFPIGYEVSYSFDGGMTWVKMPSGPGPSFQIDFLMPEQMYLTRARSICGEGDTSEYSETVRFVTKGVNEECLPPMFLATNVTMHSIQVYWDGSNSPNATGFIVSYSTDMINWTEVPTGIDPPTYTIDNLEQGTTYYIRMKTQCGELGESEWAPFQEVRTLKDGENSCPSPDSLTVFDITAESATLSWMPSQSPNVVGYRVEILNEEGNQLVQQYVAFGPLETTHTFTGLTSGTMYIARVYSICPNGIDTVASENPPYIDFRTVKISQNCPTVRKFAINEITVSSAVVQWERLNAAIGYYVDYSFDGGSTWQSVYVQSPPANLEGLMPGTGYVVRIRTVCKEGLQSLPSQLQKFETKSFNEVCSRPEFNVSINPDGTVNINIQTGIVPTGPWRWWVNKINTIVAEGETENPNFTIEDLDPKGTYQICIVQMCNINGQSITSEPTCRDFTFNTDPTKCAEPVNLRYNFLNQPNSALIQWDIPMPNNVKSYKLFIAAGNNGQTAETESREYVMKGLLKGVRYYVCVQSVCISPGATSPSFSDTVCVSFVYGEDPNTCPSVRDTKVGEVTKNTAEIFWAGVPGAVSYIIEYSTDFQNWESIEVPGNVDLAILEELEDNTKYYYRIITICRDGKSQPSRIFEFKTKQGGVNECPKPERVVVNRITANSGRLEWVFSNAVPNEGFQIILTSPDGTIQEFTAGSDARNFLFQNLSPNTTYRVSIRTICINKEGETFYSDEVVTKFTTKEGQGQCPKPKELKATQISFNSAVLTWVGSPAASSYIIRYRELPDGPIQTIQTPQPPFTLSGLNAGSKYGVMIVAVCTTSSGGSITSDSTTTVFETPKVSNDCPTPVEVRVDSITATEALVSWVGDQNVMGYEVWLFIGNTWTKVADTQSLSYYLEDLAPGTQYQVKIKAICKTGASEFSRVVRFVTKKKSCPAPTQITIKNITYNSAVVSWPAVPGAVSYVVSYFKDGDPNSLVSKVSVSNSITLTELEANTMYVVRVRTRCEDNSLSEPTETDFRTGTKPVCKSPDTLTVTNITTNSALISWNAVPGALGYELLIRKDSDQNFTTITVATNQKTVDGLSDNTIYIYKIRTICTDGDKSDFTPPREFKTIQICGVPQNVKTTVINTFDATVVWDAVNGATKYEVKVIVDGSPITLNANTNTVNITGLSPKSTVIVQVRSICGPDNISPYSPPITFVTKALPCNKPEGLSTITVTTSSAILTWSTVPNSVAYEVVVTGPNNYSQTQTVVGPPATFTGMTQNTTYEYKVRTLCADNEKSDFVSSTFTTLQFVCEKVTGVTVTNISQSGAVVSWTAPGPGYQYEVSYSTDNGVNYTTLPVTVNTNIQLSGLPSATTILVRVKTICGNNGSSDYVSTEFRTLDAGVCSTPTNLAVSNITINSALVTWDAVPGAISYQVSYKDVNANFYTTVNVTQNSRILTNLVANTEYVVRVRARCASGVNPYTEWTELKTFTTKSEANTCGTPSIIDAVPTRNNAKVSWTSVPGATSYRLAYSSNGGLTFVNLAWTPGTSQTISNLSPNKDYLVRVRAKCTNNTQSPFSSAFLFTTLASRMDEMGQGEAITLTVYPNPTKGATSISFESTMTTDVSVRLIDVTGREILNLNHKAIEGKNEIPLELGGYSSGVYQLQMIHNGVVYHAKLIVQ